MMLNTIGLHYIYGNVVSVKTYLNVCDLGIRARMHEPGVSATSGLKSSYAGLACKVGMHDTVVALFTLGVSSVVTLR